MYKVEAGILFCRIEVKDIEDTYAEWKWTKAGNDLDIITSFWELEDNNTKIVTCDGDIFCIDVPFDKFSELLIKHRNTYRKVLN